MIFLRILVLGWWFVMSSGSFLYPAPTIQEVGPFSSLELCARAQKRILLLTTTQQVSACFEK